MPVTPLTGISARGFTVIPESSKAAVSRELAIVNGEAILPNQIVSNAMVHLVGHTIVYVGPVKRLPKRVEQIDAGGGYISPGFVDIHVHGGHGADFMDGTANAVETSLKAHRQHGTTTIVPTSTTGPFEHLMAMIDACRVVQKNAGKNRIGSMIAGVHLYGPYFAEDKTGCHSKDGCRPLESDEFRKYFETKMIRVATCAAELSGAKEFYAMARRRKCLITCGHSNASWNEMQQAFDAGVRHVDHFWCAMSSVPSVRQRSGVPMQGSMAEFVLMNRDMSTEVIADGCHLAPELLEFAYRMIGPDRLCLVTDCNRAMDQPPGTYQFGHAKSGTAFRSDGHVGWAANGSLASSIRGMDFMVRHMKSVTTAALPEIIRMASLTPATRIGLGHVTGSLSAGKRADILILDRNLHVVGSFARGESWN
ncbi:MAG: N-acetylglucosamine-6-phosphate deacetylase [Planctomycetota bacterium]